MKRVLKISLIFIVLLFIFVFAACEEKDPVRKDKENETIEKIELTEDMLVLENQTYIYDGLAKTPKVKILKDGEIYCELTESNNEFNIFYYDNIQQGTAEVFVETKKDNKTFSGSASVFFEIVIQVTKVTNLEELKTALSENKARIEVENVEVINEEDTLTINEFTTLVFDQESLIENFGNIINNGVLIISNENTRFNNKGEITNSGKVFVQNQAQFYNLKTFINSGRVELKNNAKFITNGQISNMENNKAQNGYYVRYSIASNEFTIPKQRYEYTANPIVPTVSSNVAKFHYIVEYENNINVSKEAKVLIKAKEDSLEYYGTKELTFTIFSPEITIQIYHTNLELLNYLKDPNYKTIEVKGERYLDGVTIHEGVKVTFFGRTYIVNKGLVNKGTLKNDGTMIIDSGVLKNEGTFENTKKVHIEDNSLLQGSVDNSQGNIYAKAPIAGVENVTVKQEIQESNLNVTFARQAELTAVQGNEDWVFAYNGSDQYPSIVTNGQYYTLNRYKKAQDTYISTSETSAVGEYKIEIVFEKIDELYYGTYSHEYKIDKTIVSLTSDVLTIKPSIFKLTEILNDVSYAKVIIGYDLYSESEEINAEIEIVENGIWTIKSNCSINKNIVNNGKIIQHYYRDESTNEIRSFSVTKQSDVVIENNGKIYANDDTWAPSGENVYIRTNLSNICSLQDESALSLETTNIYYGGENNEPSITVKINNQEVNSSNYIKEYPRFKQYGANRIYIVANADSEVIFGQKSITYYMKQGIINVSSFGDFSSALNNCNTSGLCNYGKIIIDRVDPNYYLTFRIENNVTIPQEVVVDMSNAIIGSYSGTGIKSITNNGIIIVCHEADYPATLINNSGVGRIVALVSNLNELKKVFNKNIRYDSIILMDNINCDSIETILSERQDNIAIYKNGKTLSSNITITPRSGCNITMKEGLPTLLQNNSYWY